MPGRNLYLCEEPHPLGQTALILLIVSLGLLNICLGFGLAMFLGYGPPGLEGIFDALGPIPQVAPCAESLLSDATSARSDPLVSPESIAEPVANLPADNTIAPLLEPLVEEKVLGDIRDLATAARTTMVSGQAENHD